MEAIDMHEVTGHCHCYNIAVTMQLSRPPKQYQPRACDCGFCTRHRAAYVSDPHGSVAIRIHDENTIGKYAQGDQLAEFALCRICGVLVGAFYRSDERLFAAVNVNIVSPDVVFGEVRSASPKTLSAEEKVSRWQGLWFPTVVGYGT